jgi:hypothetical protein
MIKWLKIAIGKGDVESLVAYGNHLLHSDRDINRALKYYNLAILKKYYRGYYELAYYYCEFKFNYEHFKKNIILFLDSNDEDRDLYSSPTKLRNVALLKLLEVIFRYENEKDINFLKQYCIKFGIDPEKIDKYNDRIKMREQYMTNKKKLKLVEEEGKETDCGICYERKELIVFDCLGHYMCIDCYLKVNKCPFCSIEKHQLMKIRKIPEDEPLEESNDTNIIEDVSDEEDIIESEDVSIVSTIDENNDEVDGILNINIDEDAAEEYNNEYNNEDDDEDDEDYDDDEDEDDEDDEDDNDEDDEEHVTDDEIDEGE